MKRNPTAARVAVPLQRCVAASLWFARAGHPSALLCACAAVLLGACSGPDTAVRLHLVPDPKLNTEAQVLAVVQSLDLVMDGRAGFAGVSAPGEAGSFTAVDIDADGVLELRLQRKLKGRDALPQFLLLRGESGEGPFELAAHGRAGDNIVALGELRDLRFHDGEERVRDLPFDLRPGHRAPRVDLTMPADGESSVPTALGEIYVQFSKVVKGMEQHVSLRFETQDSATIQVPGSVVVAAKSVMRVGHEETFTTATIKLGCALGPGTYRIEATAQIIDEKGLALDQDASVDGANGFVGRFRIDGQPGDEPCSASATECKRPEDCNVNLPAGTGAKSTYRCADGSCVADVDECGGLCTTGDEVCDAPKKTCVPDCREHGCDSLLHSCETGTGLCRPCDFKTSCADALVDQCKTELCLPTNEQHLGEQLLGQCDAYCDPECLPRCEASCGRTIATESCASCVQSCPPRPTQ